MAIVVLVGDIYRIVEPDGETLTLDQFSRPVDGGGFRNRAQAEEFAKRIREQEGLPSDPTRPTRNTQLVQ